MNIPTVEVYDPRFGYLTQAVERMEVWADDCGFTEGPVWHREGYYLFSDIPAETVYRIEQGRSKTVFLTQSGGKNLPVDALSEQRGSNGLHLSGETLYLCQHGAGAVARLTNGEAQPIIETYLGKRFNSPNDLVMHPDGTLFFTDPPYGLKDAKLNPDFSQPAAGLYALRGGEVALLTTELNYPNGVCLSPDGRVLYCCSNKPEERRLLYFDAKNFTYLGVLCEENGDGIKCDAEGNLYLCTRDGILIVNSHGKRLARIQFDTIPANCCFGGPEGKDLLITARENVWWIPDFLT